MLGYVADRADRIYVAETGGDRIDVFNSNGALQASYPSSDGHGHQALSLNAPEGVATDAFGDIFVADTGGNRVLKLSSLGQIMLTIQTPGKPDGVAVDIVGYIYASDRDHAQVLKFNAAGSQMQVFALPGSKPAGIAVDAAGNLYVADPKKKRLVVFNSSGTIVNTFTSPGVDLVRPYGVAVSTNGQTIAVSDMSKDRVWSLDALGQVVIGFGGPKSGLSGPRGLAFDASGELYMAERPVNKVLKLGPPAPGTAPVPFANKLVLLGQTNAFVTAAVGGQLVRPDGAALVLPPGALPEDMDVSLSSPVFRLQAEEDLKNRKMAGDNLVAVSTGVAYGPDVTKLNTAAEVVVPYDPVAVATLGTPDLGLKLYWWNPNKQDWIWVPSRIDPKAKTAHGQGIYLGLYKVVAPKTGN